MSKLFAGAAGNCLAANAIGHGPRAALLLHGGGQTRHAWAKTAHRLADAGWSVVAIDQRGHGDSEWVADGAYAFADYAADAAAVAHRIAQEHGEEPVAVGASLGGIAALLALDRAADDGRKPPFSGLALVDVVPRMDPRGSSMCRASCARRSARASARSRRRRTPSPPTSRTGRGRNRSTASRRTCGCTPTGAGAGIGTRASSKARARSTPIARRCARRSSGRGAGLRIATLLVRGGASELVSPEAAREFLETAPGAEFADVAEARHMVAGDRNDAFAEAIIGFLERRFPRREQASAAAQ